VFQRKNGAAAWEDSPAEPLSSLKKDEGYKLSLSSTETLTFFQSVAGLYQLYGQEGIPGGQREFVRAKGALRSLAALSEG
jgi:hypothetical protein